MFEVSMTRSSQPALFVPHGAPTFALRPGAAGAALARYAASLPRPRAIIAISAHWAAARPTVSHASRLETIHDFSGFPRELYDIRYPATGCPEAAREVAAALEQAGLQVDRDARRGLDHGAWVPLRIMFPEADVPLVPLSIEPHLGPDHALRVGRALAPLRERGLLVVASGNVTHNLGDYFHASRSGRTPGYVREFADWIWERLAARDFAGIVDYRRSAPHAIEAHPTEEHLLPLYVALGAGGEDCEAERIHAGIDDYVLAMDAYAFRSPATQAADSRPRSTTTRP
jgi:4,5-DOPA dioxygenase extradiol